MWDKIKYWFVNLSYSVFLKIIPIFVLILVSACSPKIIYLPSETEVVYRDSIITQIDSVEVPLPVEVVKEVAFDYAPLHMETSLAEADVVADTTNRVLVGKIKNKPKAKIPVETKIEYHARDSVVREPYPVEVKVPEKYVPWWVKTLAWIGGIASLAALAWIIGKLIIK